MRHHVLTIAAVVLCSGCAAAPRTLTDSERAAIGDTLLAKTEQVAEGGRKVDVQATFGMTSTNTAFMAADNGQLYSHDALLAGFTKQFAELRSQDIKLDEKHVTVLTPDIGVVSAKGVFSSTDLKGKVSPPTPFAWTFVWVRENGQWRWINGHESFGAPPTK